MVKSIGHFFAIPNFINFNMNIPKYNETNPKIEKVIDLLVEERKQAEEKIADAVEAGDEALFDKSVEEFRIASEREGREKEVSRNPYS